jgi:hypothetical protein
VSRIRLADAVSAISQELLEAKKNAISKGASTMVFDECEFEFAVETEGSGGVGFSVWVLDISAEAKRTSSNTVRVKFKGNPANPIAAPAVVGTGAATPLEQPGPPLKRQE